MAICLTKSCANDIYCSYLLLKQVRWYELLIPYAASPFGSYETTNLMTSFPIFSLHNLHLARPVFAGYIDQITDQNSEWVHGYDHSSFTDVRRFSSSIYYKNSTSISTINHKTTSLSVLELDVPQQCN